MRFFQSVKSLLVPSGSKTLAEPDKELRFTRAAQAPLFIVVSAVFFFLALGLFILSTQDWGVHRPLLEGWVWGIIPLFLACFIFFRIALRCVIHAYIILSPLGIEIFPFFRPEKNLQIIYWQQIEDAEISGIGNQLTLHFSAEKQSGIVVSLKPIPKSRWKLLEKAILQTLEKNKNERS